MAAEVFMASIVKLHSFLKSIVFGKDKVFTSRFWQLLFQLCGTTLGMSSSYHPQLDGQSEVVNKCSELYLRCFTSQNPRTWSKMLPWVKFWYNTSFHTSIGMTSFKAMYGRDPPTLIIYDLHPSDPPLLQALLSDIDTFFTLLKANLLRAQQVMKKFADARRRFVEYDIGDMVLVKLQPVDHALF